LFITQALNFGAENLTLNPRQQAGKPHEYQQEPEWSTANAESFFN